MKLTWFGGTTIRIHIGGEMLVADAEAVPDGIDRAELVSGADRTFSLSGMGLRAASAATWRPRPIGRAINEAEPQPVGVLAIGDYAVLIDAAGEPPLALIAGASHGQPGRWASDAVVVAFAGCDAKAILKTFRPKLIALAADDATVERHIADLRDRLDDTGLVALEPGLALEV